MKRNIFGTARAALKRLEPDWSITRFSMVTFDKRTIDGRCLEIEWLGWKALISLGRLPRR